MIPLDEPIDNKGAGNFGSLEDASNGGDAENLSSDASASHTFSANQVKDEAAPSASDLNDSDTPPDDEGENDEDLEAGLNDTVSAQHVPPDVRCELCAG